MVGRRALLLLVAALSSCGGSAGDDDDVLPRDAAVRDGALRDGAPRDGTASDGARSDGGGSPIWCGLNFAARTIPLGHACTGAALVFGTGLDQLTPLADNDTVTMYMGPQGGLMLYLAYRVTGLDLSDVSICARQRFVVGGAEVGLDCWQGPLTDLAIPGGAECTGLFAQTSPMYWGMPDAVLGHDLVVDFTVTDKNGCQLSVARAVRVAAQLGSN